MNDDRYQILVVDDDPHIPELIKFWLTAEYDQQVAVTNVTDSSEALGRIHSDPIDLLITDIDMPALNGYHLLKQLKETNPFAQVMFLTGHPSDNAFRSARQMGADEYVLKPVKRQPLLSCVRYLLKRMDRWRVDLNLDPADQPSLTELAGP